MKKEFKDTKGVIRIRISKKNRQHNGQKKKYKGTNNDLQNIYIKLKNRVTRTSLIKRSHDIMCDVRCSWMASIACSVYDTRFEIPYE
jgi:hypothetical protein